MFHSPHRRRRPRVAAIALVLGASALAPVVGPIAPAHASFDITHVTNVFDVPSRYDTTNAQRWNEMKVRIGKPADCDHLPGILREGRYWTTTNIIGGTVGVHVPLTTHYKSPVATAMAAYKEIYGADMPCNTANGFDNYGVNNGFPMGDGAGDAGDLAALRDVVCAAGSPRAGSRFCQVAMRNILYNQTVPAQLDMQTNTCRNMFIARDATGAVLSDVRAYGYAAWNNLGVYLQSVSRDGLTFRVYLNDIDQRLGVEPTESDGTTNTTKPLVPYGKVQTYWDSDLWVRFYDAVSSGLGYNPVWTPVAAYNAVDTAISNNKTVVFTDPVFNAKAAWNVRSYRNAIFRGVCSASPWVSAALRDSSRSDYAVPFTQNATTGAILSGGIPATAPSMELVLGTCDVGFRLVFASSADGVLTFLQDFVRHENNGVLPSELTLAGGGWTIPMIIHSAWHNTGFMSVNDPFNSCAPRLTLGTGRWNHGVNLAKNFSGLL
jgi:hypothetical protein